MTWAREPIDIETWPAVYAVLAPSLRRTGETVAELIDLLISGTNQLWVLRKGGDPVAVAVSELEVAPNRLVHLRLIAGRNMPVWLGDAIDTIAAFAREQNCQGVRGEARPGMAKALAKHGWKQTRAIMEMRLEPMEATCGR